MKNMIGYRIEYEGKNLLKTMIERSRKGNNLVIEKLTRVFDLVLFGLTTWINVTEYD